MALDPLRRQIIQERVQEGGYVSPHERDELTQTRAEEQRAPNNPSPAIDAMVTSTSNFALNQGLPDVPLRGTLASGVSSLVGDVVSGQDPEYASRKAAKATGRGAIREGATQGAYGLFGRTYGGALAGGTIGEMLVEGFKDSPNYTRAGLRSGVAKGTGLAGLFLGGPVGAVFGGLAGGILGRELVDDGFIGDAFDVRVNEGYRDKLEDQYGYFQGETQYDGFERNDPGTQLSILEGGYGPGRDPSYTELAENTSSSDPIGNIGRQISGLFDGGNDFDDSREGYGGLGIDDFDDSREGYDGNEANGDGGSGNNDGGTDDFDDSDEGW